MALTTLARIRALSGFRPSRITGDTLGIGNGVNLVFSPRSTAVFVSPVDDVPNSSEISVFVDGSPVGINTISENAVVLSAPPADASVVTADYWGHNLASTEVQIVRSEVEGEVFGKLISMYAYSDLETSPLIGKIVAYLAAASLSDQAYNEAGANTVGNQYPPERLRRVAYALLEEVLMGTIILTDGSNVAIPVIEEIEGWIESTYGNTDRLFENDQFYAKEDGTLFRASDDTPWRWQ